MRYSLIYSIIQRGSIEIEASSEKDAEQKLEKMPTQEVIDKTKYWIDENQRVECIHILKKGQK